MSSWSAIAFVSERTSLSDQTVNKFDPNELGTGFMVVNKQLECGEVGK